MMLISFNLNTQLAIKMFGVSDWDAGSGVLDVFRVGSDEHQSDATDVVLVSLLSVSGTFGTLFCCISVVNVEQVNTWWVLVILMTRFPLTNSIFD